jgi:hypothetical protein
VPGCVQHTGQHADRWLLAERQRSSSDYWRINRQPVRRIGRHGQYYLYISHHRLPPLCDSDCEHSATGHNRPYEHVCGPVQQLYERRGRRMEQQQPCGRHHQCNRYVLCYISRHYEHQLPDANRLLPHTERTGKWPANRYEPISATGMRRVYTVYDRQPAGRHVEQQHPCSRYYQYRWRYAGRYISRHYHADVYECNRLLHNADSNG